MKTVTLSVSNVRALWRRLLGLVVLVTVSAGVCLAAFAITARASSATHDSVQEGVANRVIQLDRLGDRPDAAVLTSEALKSVSTLAGVSSWNPSRKHHSAIRGRLCLVSCYTPQLRDPQRCHQL